jgi:hypothetical protein
MGPALLPTPLSPAVGPEGRLSPDVSRASCLGSGAMSPGARAGAGSVGGWVRSEDPSLASGGSETGLPFLDSQAALRPESLHTIETSPVCPAFRLRTYAVSTLRELTDQEISRFPLLHPAASRGRLESGSKISSFLRVLPPQSEEPIPALDDLRMRRKGESGKLRKRKFSTFKRFSGGQEWITQPLVAWLSSGEPKE